MTVLVTERLSLRPPVPGDWEAFSHYTAGPRFNRERGELPVAERWRYFAALLGHWQIRGWGRFMATERATGRIIGHMGPLFPEGWPEAEIAWHLWHDADEGRGLAFEGARACVDHAFRGLNWPTAVSYIVPDNLRSARLAERLGARPDPSAPTPGFADGHQVVVWRHSAPGGAA
jgi:RimJ/RimL family protein N-acetyltransferase